MARDWLSTLFRTSFKGASFWVESDAEIGGRRVVVHEFPMRDDPYLEDLGEKAREFDVTAYLASDTADSEADRLRAACTTRGAGVLVLPTQGAVLVKCLDFERTFERDRQGFIAFRIKCVREGFSSALATVASLINMIFVQADAAALALAQTFAQNIQVRNVPDYIAESVTTGLQDTLSSIELVRIGHVVDPTVSALQRDAITTQISNAAEVIASEDQAQIETLAQTIITIATDLGAGMEPNVAMPAFMEMVESVPYEYVVGITSPWKTTFERNKKLGNTFTRLTALIAYCEAVARAVLPDRPTAITLRANVAARFDAELEALHSDDYELFYVITKMRDATVEYLSRTILDLAQVKKFDTSRSMPSLYWAWRLYADPTRSTEIVERNRVPHPSFIPLRFEALSR